MNPQRVARIGATATLTIAALSLLGWLLLRRLLETGLLPDGFIVMPLSAIGCIAIGAGLLLVARETPGPAARICAGVAIGLAAAVLFEYLLGVQGGVEDVVFGDAGA